MHQTEPVDGGVACGEIEAARRGIQKGDEGRRRAEVNEAAE